MFKVQTHIFDAKRDVEKLEVDVQSTTKWLSERDFNTASPAYQARLKYKNEIVEKLEKTKQDLVAKQIELARLVDKFGRRIDYASVPKGRPSEAKWDPQMDEKVASIIQKSKALLESNESLMAENKKWRERMRVMEERLRKLDSQPLQDRLGGQQILEINGFIERQVKALSAQRITQLVEDQGAAIVAGILQSPEVEAHVSQLAEDAARNAAKSELQESQQTARPTMQTESDVREIGAKEIDAQTKKNLTAETLTAALKKYGAQVIQDLSSKASEAKQALDRARSDIRDDVVAEVKARLELDGQAVKARLERESRATIASEMQKMKATLEPELRNAVLSGLQEVNDRLEPDLRAAVMTEIDQAVPKASRRVLSTMRELLVLQICDKLKTQVRNRLDAESTQTPTADLVKSVASDLVQRILPDAQSMLDSQTSPTLEPIETTLPSENIRLERETYFQQFTDALVREIETGHDSPFQTALEQAVLQHTQSALRTLEPKLSRDLRLELEESKTPSDPASRSWIDECTRRFHEASESVRDRDKEMEEFKIKTLEYFKTQIPQLIAKIMEQHYRRQDELLRDSQKHATLLRELKDAGECTDAALEDLHRLSDVLQQHTESLRGLQAARERTDAMVQDISGVSQQHTDHLRVLEAAGGRVDSMAKELQHLSSVSQQHTKHLQALQKAKEDADSAIRSLDQLSVVSRQHAAFLLKLQTAGEHADTIMKELQEASGVSQQHRVELLRAVEAAEKRVDRAANDVQQLTELSQHQSSLLQGLQKALEQNQSAVKTLQQSPLASQENVELLRIMRESGFRTDTAVKELEGHVQEVRDIVRGGGACSGGHSTAVQKIDSSDLKLRAMEAMVQTHDMKINSLTTEELFDGMLTVLRREYPVVDYKVVLEVISKFKDEVRAEVEAIKNALGGRLFGMQGRISRMEDSSIHVAKLLIGLHRLLQDVLESGGRVEWGGIIPQIRDIFDGPLAQLSQLVAYDGPQGAVSGDN
jgi:hypothetical protein